MQGLGSPTKCGVAMFVSMSSVKQTTHSKNLLFFPTMSPDDRPVTKKR